MLTSGERDGVNKIQYYFLLSATGLTLVHYALLGYRYAGPHLPLIPARYRDELYGFFARAFPLLWNPLAVSGLVTGLLVCYGLGAKGKKDDTIRRQTVVSTLLLGALLMGAAALLGYRYPPATYSLTELLGWMGVGVTGQLLFVRGATHYRRLMPALRRDLFNEENETFQQETRRIDAPYGYNFPMQFQWAGRLHNGYVNLPNPFRGMLVVGGPGSGKSYTWIEPIIQKSLMRGFCGLIYDVKFPTGLTPWTMYCLQVARSVHPELKTQLRIINFDDVQCSHRCNPLDPVYLTGVLDANEAAVVLLTNLNRKWIDRRGDFFVDSAINFVTACLWTLRQIAVRHREAYETSYHAWVQAGRSGKAPVRSPLCEVCSLPHLIEFINHPYKQIFSIIRQFDELGPYVNMFIAALDGGAAEQLEGQIASARNALAPLASATLYWVMTGNDFRLDINHPDDPSLLILGNNYERINIYGGALGLYACKTMSLINKPNQVPTLFAVDEMPTLYLKGIANLMATARSNKVAVLLGVQDLSQLARDYGDKEAQVIEQIAGNILIGQVTGRTAEALSKRFGKTNQLERSNTFSKDDTTTQVSVRPHELLPASKMATFTAGHFAGVVASDYGLDFQTIFNARILREQDPGTLPLAQSPPIIYDFTQKLTDAEKQTLLHQRRPTDSTPDDVYLRQAAARQAVEQNYRRVLEQIALVLDHREPHPTRVP